MVEVKSVGKIKIKETKCCGCNSILRFNSLDEKEKYIRDTGFEGQATNWYIECPNCKTNVPTRSLTEQNYYEWYKTVCELCKSEYEGECPANVVCYSKNKEVENE